MEDCLEGNYIEKDFHCRKNNNRVQGCNKAAAITADSRPSDAHGTGGTRSVRCFTFFSG